MLPSMIKFTGSGGSESAGGSRHTARAPVSKQSVNKGKGLASQRKKKGVASKPSSKKRKSTSSSDRQNYAKMNAVDYSQLRQGDWYLSARDTSLDDHSFWCQAQEHILVDLYLSLSKPIRPMHPFDFATLQKEDCFY
jgi:hypothetical protein